MEMHYSHMLRLGLYLYLALYYYELRNNKHEASRTAKQAIDKSMNMLSELERNFKARVSLTILQILKENSSIRINEYTEDEIYK